MLGPQGVVAGGSSTKLKRGPDHLTSGHLKHADEKRTNMLRTAIGTVVQQFRGDVVQQCRQRAAPKEEQLYHMAETCRDKVVELIQGELKSQNKNRERVRHTEMHMDFLTKQLERRELFAQDQRKGLMKEIILLREQLWRLTNGADGSFMCLNDLAAESENSAAGLETSMGHLHELLQGGSWFGSGSEDPMQRFKAFATKVKREKELEVERQLQQRTKTQQDTLSDLEFKVQKLTSDLDVSQQDNKKQYHAASKTLERNHTAITRRLAARFRRQLKEATQQLEAGTMAAHDDISLLSSINVALRAELAESKTSLDSIRVERNDLATEAAHLREELQKMKHTASSHTDEHHNQLSRLREKLHRAVHKDRPPVASLATVAQQAAAAERAKKEQQEAEAAEQQAAGGASSGVGGQRTDSPERRQRGQGWNKETFRKEVDREVADATTLKDATWRNEVEALQQQVEHVRHRCEIAEHLAESAAASEAQKDGEVEQLQSQVLHLKLQLKDAQCVPSYAAGDITMSRLGNDQHEKLKLLLSSKTAELETLTTQLRDRDKDVAEQEIVIQDRLHDLKEAAANKDSSVAHVTDDLDEARRELTKQAEELYTMKRCVQEAMEKENQIAELHRAEMSILLEAGRHAAKQLVETKSIGTNTDASLLLSLIDAVNRSTTGTQPSPHPRTLIDLRGGSIGDAPGARSDTGTPTDDPNHGGLGTSTGDMSTQLAEKTMLSDHPLSIQHVEHPSAVAWREYIAGRGPPPISLEGGGPAPDGYYPWFRGGVEPGDGPHRVDQPSSPFQTEGGARETQTTPGHWPAGLGGRSPEELLMYGMKGGLPGTPPTIAQMEAALRGTPGSMGSSSTGGLGGTLASGSIPIPFEIRLADGSIQRINPLGVGGGGTSAPSGADDIDPSSVGMPFVLLMLNYRDDGLAAHIKYTLDGIERKKQQLWAERAGLLARVLQISEGSGGGYRVYHEPVEPHWLEPVDFMSLVEKGGTSKAAHRMKSVEGRRSDDVIWRGGHVANPSFGTRPESPTFPVPSGKPGSGPTVTYRPLSASRALMQGAIPVPKSIDPLGLVMPSTPTTMVPNRVGRTVPQTPTRGGGTPGTPAMRSDYNVTTSLTGLSSVASTPTNERTPPSRRPRSAAVRQPAPRPPGHQRVSSAGHRRHPTLTHSTVTQHFPRKALDDSQSLTPRSTHVPAALRLPPTV